MDIFDILIKSRNLGASDIHINEGYEPIAKVNGKFISISNKLLTKLDTEKMANDLIENKNIKIEKEFNELDFSISIKNSSRFRVNIYKQRGSYAIAIRIINSKIPSIDNLGLPSVIKEFINKESGLILVTGPTGSGKTTTLYSILNDFKSMDKNIVTIEDPVEYKIEGINQIPLNTKIGLDFASGLRAILRQDPDIIMVGEIRDIETAKIAMRAASTGHLVISTMHTNNAVEAINRLLDMDIPRYLIASCLKGIVSQRLVRRVCKNCSIETIIDKEFASNLKIELNTKVKLEKGCNECSNTGYKGRIALNEVVEVNKYLRQAIIECKNIEEIYNIAKESNMIKFEDSCTYLLNEKITTVNECLSVDFFND